VKRKFITNLILVIFLNLLVKPFWIFGIDRTVQNVAGADQYGFYFSLLSFSLLLNILLDIGITNFNNRAIAQEPSLISEYFSNIIILKILLGIIYAIICMGTGMIIGYNDLQFKMLIFLVINQFLASFLLYLRSNISGLQYFRIDSLISVLDRTIAIVICGILLWGNITEQVFRIEWFVYAQTAAYIITVIVAFFIVLSKTEFLRFRVDIKYFLSVLKKSYPFALLILLMSFYNRIDSVMLERILADGKTEAGIYAQSFRILDAAGMFAFLFAGLLLPIFSRMIKQNDPLGDMVSLSFKLIIIPALALACLSVYYSQYIITWMYNEHEYYSSRIFPLLMIGFVSISTTYIFGTLLTASGNLKELNILAGITLLLNIILNLILIPFYQAFGAAIASLITQTFMAVAQVILAVKKFKFQVNRKLISNLISYTIIIFILGWFSRTYLNNWFAGASVLIILTILFAFLTRLLNLKDIYRIVRFGDEQEVL
jgi:O-antigen/teichoic acid export membrane protein